MSKTVEDLKQVYIDALCASDGAISAGIAAVVRELMEHFVTGASTYAWDADDLHAEFMKILGDAGDEVAGVLAVESREVAMVPEATEAPAAAPAVCVWTLVYRTSGCGMWERKCTETPQWCELPIGLMYDGHPCFCGLPISFTEALTKGGMIAAAGDGT